MQAYILDIVIVLVLALFAWRGAKKGLILMLCSLLGLFVAFFGARWTANRFYEPVADIIEPPIYQAILDVTEEFNEEVLSSLNKSSARTANYSLDELLDLLEETELFPGFLEYLETALDQEELTGSASQSAARSISIYLAPIIAKAALFSLTFLIVLLVWFLVGRALDLAFKLPGLSALNLAGGLVLGLVKAALLIMVLIWICQRLGWIPNPPETPVVTMFTVDKVLSLLNGLIA